MNRCIVFFVNLDDPTQIPRPQISQNNRTWIDVAKRRVMRPFRAAGAVSGDFVEATGPVEPLPLLSLPAPESWICRERASG